MLLNEIELDLHFIQRRANDLQSNFEICDDINLAALSALKMLRKIEVEAPQVMDREDIAA